MFLFFFSVEQTAVPVPLTPEKADSLTSTMQPHYHHSGPSLKRHLNNTFNYFAPAFGLSITLSITESFLLQNQLFVLRSWLLALPRLSRGLEIKLLIFGNILVTTDTHKNSRKEGNNGTLLLFSPSWLSEEQVGILTKRTYDHLVHLELSQ